MELSAAEMEMLSAGDAFSELSGNQGGVWLHLSSVDWFSSDVSFRQMSGQRLRWFQLMGMPNSLVFIML